MNEFDDNEYLWSERYRPRRIVDCILPSNLKDMFQAIVDNRQMINFVFSGGPGRGKTTVAQALCNELDYDFIVLNVSRERGIDTVRTTIQQFASTASFTGQRKCAILDEADNMTLDMQKALRALIEEFSINCAFILTCNYKNRIIEPIRESRCDVVDFDIPKTEQKTLAEQMLNRLCDILDNEVISYEKKAVAAVIIKYFPDWRRTINVIQRIVGQYGAVTDENVVSITNDFVDSTIDELIGILAEKDFTAMRKWVGEHTDIDPPTLFRLLYDKAATRCSPRDGAKIVMVIAQYLHWNMTTPDPEINTAACLAEIMGEVTWKK